MTEEKQLRGSSLGDVEINLGRILLFALYACTFVAFLSKGMWTVTGPIMAVLCAFLYFTGYSEAITALIIVANDAMGTIIGGSLSFPYLLLILAVARLVLYKRRVTGAEALFLIVSLVLQIELLAVGLINLRNVIYSMTFVLGFFVLPRDGETAQRLSRGMIAAMVIIALHAVLTGGVEYTEVEVTGMFSSETVVRYGVLGAGSGDPNLSSFLINMGLACTLGDRKMHWLWKLGLSVLFLLALSVTVSVSGLLAAICILILFLLIGNQRGKGLMLLGLALLAVVVAFEVYIGLPSTARMPMIDSYVLRIEEALGMASAGDFAGATTNRSEILTYYLHYLVTQPTARFLLGGNSLKVGGHGMPHNTYVGFVLQIGALATAFLLFWMAGRVWKNLREEKTDLCRKRNLLLKVLSLFMAFTLSFYEGSLWALWMYFVILL